MALYGCQSLSKTWNLLNINYVGTFYKAVETENWKKLNLCTSCSLAATGNIAGSNFRLEAELQTTFKVYLAERGDDKLGIRTYRIISYEVSCIIAGIIFADILSGEASRLYENQDSGLCKKYERIRLLAVW